MKKKYDIGVRVEIRESLISDITGNQITNYKGVIEDVTSSHVLFGIRTDDNKYFAIKGDDLTIIKN